jgi:hypothetical protein
MVVLAFISDPSVIRKIIDHLRLPSSDPPRAPARVLEFTSSAPGTIQTLAFPAHRHSTRRRTRIPPELLLSIIFQCISITGCSYRLAFHDFYRSAAATVNH